MTEARKEVAVKKGEIQKAPARTMTPFDEMERMFEDFFGRGWMRPWRWERPFLGEQALAAPKVNVVDRDEEVLVEAEVPGVEKDDLEVSISGNMLSIRGKSEHEEKEEKGNYYRSEITRGSFARTLTLPAEVDEAKAKAELKDGVLHLALPKADKAKRRLLKIV